MMIANSPQSWVFATPYASFRLKSSIMLSPALGALGYFQADQDNISHQQHTKPSLAPIDKMLINDRTTLIFVEVPAAFAANH